MSSFKKLEHNYSIHCWHVEVEVNHKTFGHMVSDVTVCALDLALMFIAVAANGLAIFAYRKTTILQTPSNFLLMMLSIVDVALALTVQPLFFIWKIMEILDSFSCAIYLATSLSINFLGAISFLITSFLVSMERYLSVFHPLMHRRNANKTVLKLVLLVVSIVWLVFLLVTFFLKHHTLYYIVTASLVALCLLGTIACYRSIFKEISQRCGDRSMSVDSITDNRRPSGRFKREKSTLTSMIFIVAAMTLLYFPIGACVMYATLIGRDWLYMNFFVPWAYVLVFTSNAIHPFLYGWKNRGMRQSINGMIRHVFEDTDV